MRNFENETAADRSAVSGARVEDDKQEHSPHGCISKLLRSIRGIIFDFDGTLFDNVLIAFYLISAYPPDILRVWKERLIRKSFTGRDYLTPERYYRTFFAAMGKACSRSPERMRVWYFNRYMPRMIRMLKKHYKPRPGTVELFQNFNNSAGGKSSSKIPQIAVYSDYPSLRERLEALGIKAGPGIRLYGPESFGAQKPAVRPFKAIARDFGVAPEEVLVIGDRDDTDGLGAFNAGMHFFCIETGRRRYFRLDPYRHPPIKDGKAHGPSLLMYAGVWDDLVKQLLSNLFEEQYAGK